MASRNIKGITVEIGGDTTGLDKALAGVNKTINETQSQLKDVEGLLKFDPSNTELLTQKQELLTKEIKATTEKLDTLKSASEQANKQLEEGTITKDEYNALQREIASTEQQLNKYKSQLSETNSASTQLKATIANEEKQLASLSSEYKNAVIEKGADSDEAKELASRYTALSSELDANKKMLADAEKATKDLGKQQTSTAGDTDDLTDSSKSAEKSTESLGKQESSTAKNSDTLAKSMDDVSDEVEDAGDAADDATSKFDSFAAGLSEKCKSAAASCGEALLDLTKKAADLAVQLGQTCVESYAEFESQMSSVESLMIGSVDSEEELADAMDSLSEKAEDLGATTSFTATEVGEAMEYMAMAGWDVDDTLTSVEAVVNLAAASGEDLASVSDILTDSMTALGLAADEEYAPGVSNAAHYADVLTAATTSSNTTISALGESFKYVAPIAGTMGASAEDLSVALGLMANSGIKGSQAGTSLKTALTNMTSPTAAQAAAMEELGLTITNADGSFMELSDIMDEMRDVFSAVDVELVDAEGNARDYEDIIDDLSQTEEGLTQAEQLSAAATIFGSQSMAGMLAIINATDEDYQALTESINNCSGTAEEMADIKLDNLDGSITLLKSAASGAATSIGKKLEPACRDLVDAATDVVTAFNEGGVSGALETASQYMQTLIPELLDQIVNSIPELVSGFGKMFTGVIDGLLPLLPPIISDLLPTLISSFLGIITQLISSIVAALPDLIQALVDALPTIIDAICQFLQDDFPVLLQAAIDFLMAIVDAIPDIIDALVEELPNIIETLITTLMDAIPQLLDAAIELFMAIVDAIPEIITSLVDALPQILDTIVTTITSADFITSLIDAAITLFMSLIEAIPQIVVSLVKALPQIIIAIVNTILSWPKKMIQGIAQAMPQVIQSFKDWFMSLPDKIKNVGKNIISGLWNGIKEKLEWLKEKIMGVVDSITGWFKNLFGIGSPSKVMRDEVGKFLPEGIGVGIEEGTKYAVNSVRDMVDEINDAAKLDLDTDYAINPAFAGSASGAVVNNYYSTDNSRTVNQTNTSPKSLSRLEIYRQTRNALGVT